MDKLKIESLSPIHIGNGESYLSLFIKNSFKVSEESVFEFYAEEILKSQNYSYNEDLIRKIVNNKEVLELYKLDEIDKEVLERRVEILENIKSISKDGKIIFYIPASSLKGFFLTAVLNNEIKKEGKKEFLRILSNRKNISQIGNFLKKEGIVNLEIEDCKLNSYKIKIAKVFYSSKKYTFLEVIDEFEGSFRIEINGKYDINKLLEVSNEYVNEYINMIKNLTNCDKISEILEKIEKEENKVILGKFAGINSKTIHNHSNKRTRYCKYLEINNKVYPIGFAKLKVL
ncbi:MAG: RAMP superfamily CRISPR-associated protein [Candidatus Aenigmatarchaeota archaeon]